MVPDEKSGSQETFRTYPIQELKGAERVRRTMLVNITPIFLTIPVDPVGGGGHMEEAVSWARSAILRCRRENLQLRLVHDWADSVNIIQHLDSNSKVSVLTWYRQHRSTPLADH